jgi:general L-amino acid transport system substrate-binding protein
MNIRRIFTILSLSVLWSSAVSSATLDTVLKRGWLSCGASEGLPGFTYPDAKNRWQGIDADF